MTENSATFRATLPPILSAIRMAGDGGMRVMFDIPETDLGEATKLLLWRGKVMQVTVGPEEQQNWQDDSTISRTKAKRRNG